MRPKFREIWAFESRQLMRTQRPRSLEIDFKGDTSGVRSPKIDGKMGQELTKTANHRSCWEIEPEGLRLAFQAAQLSQTQK